MSTKNLKPFDLQAALRGEPVMLRDGRKAFVRHHETEVMVGGQWQIWGVIIECRWMVAWARDGSYDIGGNISGLDIIGMHPKTRIINGFEVPAPETERIELGRVYFAPNMQRDEYFVRLSWDDDEFDMRSLERGVVFLSIEDAIANAKAMLGIDPYGESEE